eukprot:366449-Chlamydomonas_euryale.AAC.9
MGGRGSVSATPCEIAVIFTCIHSAIRMNAVDPTIGREERDVWRLRTPCVGVHMLLVARPTDHSGNATGHHPLHACQTRACVIPSAVPATAPFSRRTAFSVSATRGWCGRFNPRERTRITRRRRRTIIDGTSPWCWLAVAAATPMP